METENKIIRYFIENKKKLTIRALAKNLNLDYKIVHTATLRLVEKEILGLEKVGKSSYIGFTNHFSKEVFEVELKRKEDILKNKNINLLVKTIEQEIKTSIFILILFGSYAKNNFNNKSDIDLMFIVNSKEIEGKIESIFSLLPLKIHYFVFNENQFSKMKDSKEPNIVREAINSNVLLYGIESYYKLLGSFD